MVLFQQVTNVGFSDIRGSAQLGHRLPPAKPRRHLSRGALLLELPARNESLPRTMARGFGTGVF